MEDVCVCGFGRCGGMWECGGGELSNFSFVRVSRTSVILRSSGLCRTSGLFRSSGAWAKIGLQERNCENSGEEGNGEVEIEWFGGWKRVGRVGKARSTRNNTNPWTKSNKISTHKQITKKFGAIFGGEFSELGRKQQNQARKHGVGAPKT